jgi:alpha-L-fucosidase
MEVNSSSIYGTTASPFVRLPWGRATKKEYSNATDLFLHVFDWPEDGILKVDGLRSHVDGAYFLADFQKSIHVHRSNSGIVLQLPEEPLDTTNTVIVLKVKGNLDVERILPTQNVDGVLQLNISDANIYNPAYGGELEVHRDHLSQPYLQGWTDFRSRLEWLIKVDKPGEFHVFVEVAADEPSEFSLTANAEIQPFKIVQTGSKQIFKTQFLGTIRLSQPESRIIVQPLEALWNPISVRSLTLKPVLTK